MQALDRIVRAFHALVDVKLRRLPYLATYGAKVVLQHADGTLDLRVDQPDPRRSDWPQIPHPSGVPIRGLPGVAVTVAVGARVLLSWENGDPARPIATLFEPSSLTSMTITASTKVAINAPEVDLGSTAATPIAGLGDVVQVSFNPIGWQVTVSGAVGTITSTVPLGSLAPMPVTAVGQIITARATAKAGP